MKRQYVLMGIFFLGLSVFVNTAFYRPSLNTLTNGRSAGFQGRDIPDPLTPPQAEEIVTFAEPETIFRIPIELSASQLHIQFMYQSPPDAIIHLSLLDKEQKWIPFLVDHPLLYNLDWFYILDGQYVLYQRNFTHSSLSSLFQQVSPKEILIEHRAASLIGLAPDQVGNLDLTTRLDTYNYLITSRLPQGAFGDWWWFRKDILLKEAFREVDGKIYMKITTTQVPFKLTRQVISTQ